MEANRRATQNDIDAFHRDGAIALRNVVGQEWIERMRTAVDKVLASPGDAAIEYTPKERTGRYYGDFFIWQRERDFSDFMRYSTLPSLAAELLDVNEIYFFYDQLLVKEPGTEEPTPLHHDLPYWPLRGQQILSIWVPFDPVTKESGAVHYIRGSHRWGRTFAPQAFGEKSGFADQYAKMGLEPLPTWRDLEAYDHLHWDLEPGDVLVHHPLTLHYAPGNASANARRRALALRYVGPDTQYDTRPGTFMQNPRLKAILPDIELADGEPLRGPLFPKVWPADND